MQRQISCKIKTIMNLNELRDKAYKCACEHGFHDTEYPYYHWLMLTICELSEAIEADRNDRHADRDMFEKTMKDLIREDDSDKDIIFYSYFKKYIKDTVEDELADVVIRLLDFSGLESIDLTDLNTEIEEDLEPGIQNQLRDMTKALFTCCNVLTSFVFDLDEIAKTTLSGIFQYAKAAGIDLKWHIEQKMRFNELRPYLNGKKY